MLNRPLPQAILTRFYLCFSLSARLKFLKRSVFRQRLFNRKTKAGLKNKNLIEILIFFRHLRPARSNFKNMKQLTSLILIFTIYCGLLAPLSLKAQMIHGKTQKTNMNQTLPYGLQFHLSEGAEGAENRQKTPSVKGDALSDAETSNLLKRIPPIKSVPVRPKVSG